MAEHTDKALTEQAAEWLTRRHRAAWGPGDEDAFNAWMRDPAHAVAYARVEATWERAQRLQASPAALAPARRSWNSPWWRTVSAAAALMLAIGGIAWMLLAQHSVYSTQVGEHRSVVLADGSRIELNTASRLRVRFTDQRRDVQLLAGEALFHVAKDKQRPFVVHANGATVRAVGTMFNVRLRGQEMVEVTVTEGIVAVSDRAAAASGGVGASSSTTQRVEAGSGAMVGPGAVAKVPLDADALQQRTAWRRDLIELRGETLGQAVAEFNRYRDTPLVVGDPRIASIRVGGTFATGESEKFLAALQSGFDVRTVEGTDGTLYLVPMQQ